MRLDEKMAYSILLFTKSCERIWFELVTIPFIEFTLKLYPMKPQWMKEGTKRLHTKQNSNGRRCKNNKSYDNDENILISAVTIQVKWMLILPLCQPNLYCFQRNKNHWRTPMPKAGLYHRIQLRVPSEQDCQKFGDIDMRPVKLKIKTKTSYTLQRRYIQLTWVPKDAGKMLY